MTGPMWCLVVAVLACAALHYSPRDSVRELFFATVTITAVAVIPVGYLVGSW
ncbi:membrane protein [Mycobacterium phage Zenteno07]|nr:membrane protein [Mycobacterium phage Zenteno07]